MAIRSKTVQTRDAAPVVCEAGEYQGRPTFSVGIEGGNPKYNMTGGLNKWLRLFAQDVDGDSVLMNALSWTLENVETHEDAQHVMSGVNAFIAAFQAKWGEPEEEQVEEEVPAPTVDLCIRCGKPADNKTGLIMCSSCRNHQAKQMAANPVGPVIKTTTPIAPVPVEEPSPAQVEEADGPTDEQAAKLRRMLKSQTAFFRKLATHEQREFLVRDAWLMTVIGGISWEEYRDGLKAWVNDPTAYLSENGFEG